MPLGIANIDIAKNAGTSKVVDLVGQAMEEIEIDLKQLMADSSHGIHGDGTGNNGKDITGLVAAVDDGTNVDTYGDISRSSYTWWKGDYTGSGGSLSLSTMATTFDNVTSGDDEPSIIATTKSLWSSYEALLQPQVRYNIASGEGSLELEGGFKALMYRGAPMVRDEFCPSGYMYFLNEKYIDMVTLDHPDYKTDNMGFAMTDLERPTNQDGKMGKLDVAHIKSTLINLGKSVHTKLTTKVKGWYRGMYDDLQQAFRKIIKEGEKAVATTERVESKYFMLGQATV